MRDTETMRYAKARQKKESNTFPGHRSHTTCTHNNKGPEKELDIQHTNHHCMFTRIAILPECVGFQWGP